jgi:hypothetical protein
VVLHDFASVEGLVSLVPTEYNSAMVQLRNGDGSLPSVTWHPSSLYGNSAISAAYLKLIKIAISVCLLTIIKMELYSQSPLEEGGNSVQSMDNHRILVSPHEQTVFVGSTGTASRSSFDFGFPWSIADSRDMLLASCTATISITHTECQIASVEKGAELKPIHGTTALPKSGGDT